MPEGCRSEWGEGVSRMTEPGQWSVHGVFTNKDAAWTKYPDHLVKHSVLAFG